VIALACFGAEQLRPVEVNKGAITGHFAVFYERIYQWATYQYNSLHSMQGG
jgi:hypothetical protein